MYVCACTHLCVSVCVCTCMSGGSGGMCRVCVWYVYKCVFLHVEMEREQDLEPFLRFQLGTGLMEEQS